MTELSPGCINLLNQNVAANKIDPTSVSIHKLEWGKENASSFKPHQFEGSLDFIIGSDIIYIKDSFPLLLDTILELSDLTTKTVICSTVHGNLEQFERFAREAYSDRLILSEIDREWQDEQFQSEDIKIYLITLKQ